MWIEPCLRRKVFHLKVHTSASVRVKLKLEAVPSVVYPPRRMIISDHLSEGNSRCISDSYESSSRIFNRQRKSWKLNSCFVGSVCFSTLGSRLLLYLLLFRVEKKRALLCQKGKSLRKEEVMRKKPKKDFHSLFTLFSTRKCVKWDWNLWKYFPSDKKLPRGIKRRENVSSVLVAFRKMRRSWELLFEYYGSRKEIQLM